MPKLEVFFDYACPYCLRGHEYLLELLPRYPRRLKLYDVHIP